MPHTISINAHLLSGKANYRRAGIHQYIYQLLDNLPTIPDVDYQLFSNYPNPFPHLQPKAAPFSTNNPLSRILWEQTVWPWQSKQEKSTLMHTFGFVTPIFSNIPSIVTVYDLSFIHYPDRYPAAKRLYLQTQTARSCKEATKIIAISESGRQDIHQLLNIPLSRIERIYPGLNPEYKELTEEEIAQFRKKEQLPDQFILHVGTLQPRKNIPTLIDAFAQLVQKRKATAEQLQLILVGGKGWHFDTIFALITKHKLQSFVRFTDYVADEQLPYWYNAASMLIFPSIYEGFGLPILEAMACGTPVIAANSSSIPEVGGKAALLFEPEDVAQLTKEIDRLLDDSAQADTMKANGRWQAKKFNWNQSAKQLATLYAQLIDTL